MQKVRVVRSRLHPSKHHNHSSFSTSNLLIVGCILVFAWTLYRAAALQQQAHKSDPTAAQSGSLPSLEELYGPKEGLWPRQAASGPSQLLVLSYYASKASLAARLLMLSGIYAGEASQLRIDAGDKLRWWELHQLTTLNDLMLQQHSSPGLPHHLARGFHISALTKDETDYYQDRLSGIVRYLSKHKPWLMKDPRLSWLAPLWLEQLESPLCVLVVDMQPQHLAQHLAEQQQQRQMQQLSGNGELEVSAATHLERWTNATLSSLKSCFGVPTIILPSSALQPPLVEAFTPVLIQHLTAAGVQGVREPTPDLLQQQFLAHMRPGARTGSHCLHASADDAANNSTIINGAALLAEPCNWLPPKPHTGSAGAQEGGASGPDATLLPLPTQALLSALHDHLTANLAHPSPNPITYSRAAGQVYSAYASGVKQLVAQSGGSHPRNGDHHGIGALIVEALKHVESTVAAATASARQRSSRMLVQA